jgi:hypothetical protein
VQPGLKRRAARPLFLPAVKISYNEVPPAEKAQRRALPGYHEPVSAKANAEITGPGGNKILRVSRPADADNVLRCLIFCSGGHR